MAINEKLKQEIENRGFSQKAFADAAGLNPRTIEGWFSTTKNFNPGLIDFVKAAKTLGVSVDYLVGNECNSASEKYQPIVKKLESLPPEDVEKISGIIDVFISQNVNKNVNKIKET